MSRVQMTVEFHLDVAHWMDDFPEGNPNRRLHGHSYLGTLIMEGPIDAQRGVLLEYQELMDKLSPILNHFDHRLLNELEGLAVPSTELLAQQLFEKCKTEIPEVVGVELFRPTMGMKVRYPAPKV
ncbi:MAG: 6-carboxytetrahydropterin synthase [Bdellovibrionota bacterium]